MNSKNSDPLMEQGEAILNAKKAEREDEAALIRRMKRSFLNEPSLWCSCVYLYLALYQRDFQIVWLSFFILFVAFALDEAGIKRNKAMLDWIEYQKTRGQPSSIDSPPPVS